MNELNWTKQIVREECRVAFQVSCFGMKEVELLNWPSTSFFFSPVPGFDFDGWPNFSFRFCGSASDWRGGRTVVIKTVTFLFFLLLHRFFLLVVVDFNQTRFMLVVLSLSLSLSLLFSFSFKLEQLLQLPPPPPSRIPAGLSHLCQNKKFLFHSHTQRLTNLVIWIINLPESNNGCRRSFHYFNTVLIGFIRIYQNLGESNWQQFEIWLKSNLFQSEFIQLKFSVLESSTQTEIFVESAWILRMLKIQISGLHWINWNPNRLTASQWN